MEDKNKVKDKKEEKGKSSKAEKKDEKGILKKIAKLFESKDEFGESMKKFEEEMEEQKKEWKKKMEAQKAEIMKWKWEESYWGNKYYGIYEGEVKDGKPHGIGKWSNGKGD